MRYLELFENLEDWDNGVWVHYTDEDFLSMRYNNKVPYDTVKQPADKRFKKREVSRQFHQDPAGIYLFPEKFTPWPNWAKKKNVFYVTLKPDIKVLDLGNLDEQGICDFIALYGKKAVDQFNSYIKEYPPENTKKMMKMAWEIARQTMLGDYGKWNAILRRAGYDALFDDTGSVAGNEVQLIILNPKVIATVKVKPLKSNAYDNMFKIFDEVKEMCSAFGKVEAESPMKRRDWYKKELNAKVRVENADDKYAQFKITFDNEHKTVNVSLQYSNPSLDYGSGATYSTITGKYESFAGLDSLKKNLQKIFNLKESDKYSMRYKEITESPISGFETIGDFDTPHSIRNTTDRKLLTNPKAVQKIMMKWQKTPVDFNLYFVNEVGYIKFLETGEVSKEWLQENMPKIYSQLQLKDDAVNVIYTNNSGAERVPMTAWVIAHRFGHAIYRGKGMNAGGSIGYELSKIREHLVLQCSEIMKEFGLNNTLTPWNSPFMDDVSNQNLRSFYHAIGTMKSARDRSIRTEFEFVLELLAQYMLVGKITFNPLPKTFRHGKPAWGRYSNVHYHGNEHDFKYYDIQLKMLADDLTEMFESLLHSCVGHIFVV